MEGHAPELIEMPDRSPFPDRTPDAGGAGGALPPEDIVAMVSHELRTPLAAIAGALSLIRAGTVGELPPQMAPLIDMAQRNAARMAALIDDLLDAERIAEGRLTIARRPVELTEIVRAAVNDARTLAAPMEVAIDFGGEGPSVTVAGDPGRLGQALGNLLSNAAKFSPPGDRVQVTVAAEAGLARVTVADRGPGIPPELRPRIFERFWTRDTGDGRNRHGTGLGLGIARAIVEGHSGTLGFASCPGDTRFWIELPVLPSPRLDDAGHDE